MIKLKLSHLPIFCFVFFLTVNPIQAQKVTEKSRTSLNFDQDWRFLKQDAKGAEVPAFDDSKWRKLDVPHDWSIEGP